MSPSALWTALVVVVVLSPLPLGSNRPLAWGVLALAAGASLLTWAYLVQRGRLAVFWRPAFWPPLVVLVVLTAWIIVQAGALPVAGGHPLWSMTASTLREKVDPAIALAPDAGTVALLKLLTYAAIFWLALQLGRDTERAWQLLRWLAWGSAAYAGYGLVNYFAGNRWLLWYERWAYRDDVTSTFVNRNHYATFAAFGLLVATAVSIRAFQAKWRLSDRSMPALNRGVEALVGRSLVYAVIVLVTAMAWLQTHSRLGFVSGAVGLFLFLISLRVAGAIRGRWTLAASILLVPLFLLPISGDGTLARLDATQHIDRAPVFARVVDAIKASPWVGYGYGSFPAAFQLFRDTTVPSGAEYLEAHSSYLELAFELGLPATIAAVAALAWITGGCFVGVFGRRRDQLLPAVAASASAVAALHSIADFSLQIPAVASVYAALIGVGWAQSFPMTPSRAAERPHRARSNERGAPSDDR